MKHIDLSTWPRRKHFDFFTAFDYPHFNLCANVDLSRFQPFIQQYNLPFTISTIYLLACAANTIPEFRQRIRGSQVVEHDVVHPAPIVLGEGELFSFCTIPFSLQFQEFSVRAAKQIEMAKKHPTLEDEPGRDDLLFMTCIPWVSFTGLMHPIHMHPVDSTPRLAWGKFFPEGDCLKMPLSVQAHHGLMDGVHAGKFFRQVQEYLDQPAALFT
jgi:chloramphenicol O-acetyltransferase type A